MGYVVVVIGILLVLVVPVVWEWARPERSPEEVDGWRNIPGYERYQLHLAKGEVRSFVIAGRPKDIASTPRMLKRYTQRGEPSVTLYARYGGSRSFTISEVRALWHGESPSGDEYNAARVRVLEPYQIDEIRGLIAIGRGVEDIASQFGVSASTIRDIRDGRTWRDR